MQLNVGPAVVEGHDASSRDWQVEEDSVDEKMLLAEERHPALRQFWLNISIIVDSS